MKRANNLVSKIEVLEPMILMSASATDIDPATLADGTDGNDVLIALNAGQSLDGDAGHDILIGLAGNNVLSGGDGHDMLISVRGDNILKGGAGQDTAVYWNGNRAEFSVVSKGYGIVEVSTEHCTDFLYDVEKIQFRDGTFTVAELIGGTQPTPTPEPGPYPEPTPTPTPEPEPTPYPQADFDQDGKPDDIDLDDDNDGISDEDELLNIGTNPFNADTDGDGIQDGTEIGRSQGTPDSYGGPVSFRPDADPTTTTDPLNNDSDGDGLLDGEEDKDANGATPRIIGGTGTTGSGETDPSNPDTDGDGLSDGQEVKQIGSDPLDTDTDDGTVDDGTEVANGTDPVNNPGDDAQKYVAKIIGSSPIYEGNQVRSEYRVQLDQAATEDITFVIDTNDITADRAETLRDESIQYHWHEKFAYFQVTDNSDDDYTVFRNGQIVSGQFEVTVKAGQSISDTFEIRAWEEKMGYNRYANRHGWLPEAVEGTESFELDLVRAEAAGNVDVELNDRKIDIIDKDLYYLHSPIALDLNGDGEIGVTGEHTARDAVRSSVGETVQFDINADGVMDEIEWFSGDGDGILIDTSEVGADGKIDGSALFGDQGGLYANGYDKLAMLDANGDGVVSGSEAAELALWIDDGDAVLEDGELMILSDAGVASVSAEMTMDSEGRMRSSADMTDGSTLMTEDVWFAAK